ncbi:hypothetical protein CCP2SC5_560002 [Azospirillaceae bacterium]
MHKIFDVGTVFPFARAKDENPPYLRSDPPLEAFILVHPVEALFAFGGVL